MMLTTSANEPFERGDMGAADQRISYRLEDCMAAIIDYRGKTPRKTSSGIPLITAKVVKGGRIKTPTEFIADEDYDSWMRRGTPRPGDILVTTEAPLGEVAQLYEQRIALAQRLILLRGKSEILDNRFLKYLMQSAPVQDQLRARATGTTVLGIKQKELRQIELELPAIREQRAIAHILGTLDDKIELNRRMNETLEEMARALFKSWFVDFDPVRAKTEGRWCPGESLPGLPAHLYDHFPDRLVDSELGEVPEGWEVKELGEVVKVVGGTTPSTRVIEYWEGGTHCWVTPKDLSNLSSPVLSDTARKITNAGLNKISSGLLQPGTVLLSSRAPIGYLAISEKPVAINQGFIAMPPGEGISNLFMLYWCNAFREQILNYASGTTFLEISKRNFRRILIAIADAAIMDAFDKQIRPLYRRVAANEGESHLLAARRETLLPKLVSGEVRVTVVEPSSSGEPL